MGVNGSVPEAADSADQGRGGNRPSTCENPHADCYRDPDREVRWAEDYTADDPKHQMWLCDPCYAMLERGTHFSVSDMETRSGGFNDGW